MSNQITTQQVLERNVTALNSRDMEAYLANQQPDVEIVFSGNTLHGRDQLRTFVQTMWHAFPDGKLAFGKQVYSTDGAAVEVVFTGTHTGPLVTPNGTIPPTGKHIELHSASILGIKDGLIAWEHGYSDSNEMMTQLGLMPPQKS